MMGEPLRFAGLLFIGYPCRCLCRLSTQITRITPLRRIILQFRQIFLTDALTFIIFEPLVFHLIKKLA